MGEGGDGEGRGRGMGIEKRMTEDWGVDGVRDGRVDLERWVFSCECGEQRVRPGLGLDGPACVSKFQ